MIREDNPSHSKHGASQDGMSDIKDPIPSKENIRYRSTWPDVLPADMLEERSNSWVNSCGPERRREGDGMPRHPLRRGRATVAWH